MRRAYAFIAVITIMAASACPCIGAINMGVHPDNNSVDIVVDGHQFILGMFPEIQGMQKTLTPRDGSLKLTSVAESKPEDTELGRISTTTLIYSESGAEDILYLHLTIYHDMKAVAVAFDYEGEMNLRPESGLRLVINDMPAFTSAMGAERYKDHWTRPSFADKPGDLPRHTQFIIWKDDVAGYGAAIPLVGGGMRSDFCPHREKLSVAMSSYDSGFIPDVAPAMAVAWGLDPYETIHRLYKVGFDFMGTPGKLRTEKEYPDIFNHFGWCSWNAFHSAVRSEDIISAAASFKENNFPLRYILVDDGWQDIGEDRNQRKLYSFDANKKFPGGMKALTDTLKNEYGISWVGVWHTYQGYWDGIAENSEIYRNYGKSLMKSLGGSLFPNPKKRKGLRFFNAYHEKLKSEGIDFVKVDNQSSAHNFTMHLMPISYASLGWQQNLQMSVEKNFDNAIINCMCMTIENIYYWMKSNIARSSDDFFPNVPDNARTHVLHNIYNSLWYSELAWPDFDMFQSHHPQAEMHSVLRAISGGPVYVTDTPGMQNWDLLWKLVFNDGTLPRADHPPYPTRDSLFVDPAVEAVPLKAFTHVGDTGILAAFNVLGSGGRVMGTVSPSDVENLDGKYFAVYEHITGVLKHVHHKGRLPVNLPEFGSRLYVIVPIIDGAAPIGLLNKYLSTAAITKTEYEDEYLLVGLREGGEFGAWLEAEPYAVAAGNDKVYQKGDWYFKDNFFKLDIPGNDPVELKIYIRHKGCQCRENKEKRCE